MKIHKEKLGKGWSKGKKFGFQKPIEKYLNNEIKIQSYTLKLRLIKEKIKEPKCEKCKNENWLDGKIPLELHHIDGNKYNNSLDNLQILCPNCHSLTSNWNGKNRKLILEKFIPDELILKEIPNCQSISEVIRVTNLCETTVSRNRIKKLIEDNHLSLKRRQFSEKEIDAKLKQRKIPRPSPEELKQLVESKPTTTIAKELGVSDKSIEKWCKFYNISKPSRGFWIKKKYNKL